MANSDGSDPVIEAVRRKNLRNAPLPKRFGYRFRDEVGFLARSLEPDELGPCGVAPCTGLAEFIDIGPNRERLPRCLEHAAKRKKVGKEEEA